MLHGGSVVIYVASKWSLIYELAHRTTLELFNDLITERCEKNSLYTLQKEYRLENWWVKKQKLINYIAEKNPLHINIIPLTLFLQANHLKCTDSGFV